MKALLFSLMALVCTSLADPPANSGVSQPAALSVPNGPVAGPWSVAGWWNAGDRDWHDQIYISADGAFHRGNGDGGHWTLTGFKDHIMLVLAWDRWQTETVLMDGPNHFKGKTLTLRRPNPGKETGIASIETRTWHQGEPPVKIMPQDDGFCALSQVTGHFQGGGEEVKVYVGDDGYWYLGGHSMQQDVAAQCIVVRYRKTQG
ncbi:MAG TPA: hypothetical protein VHY22_16635 [Chthoniobacteraceae bacterium]|nr:hypothetical protein [Chthoniobacteraceae bacterium]